MRTFSPIALLLLLPALSLSRVTTFTSCPQFFANGIHPTVLVDPGKPTRYAQICQCLLDQNKRPVYYYATLYDTHYKIPVYTAYEFKHADSKREDRWYVEPQLDGGTQECMGGQNKIPISNRGLRQALNRDYGDSAYDKGHLYPVHHTDSEESMLATSTLTNAAPQDPTFNRGQWRRYEETVAEELEQTCQRAFVVTGVVPGNHEIGDRVRVAKYYWSAFCCTTKPGSLYSAGFIGPDNNGNVRKLSLTDLEKILSQYYDSDFSIFSGRC